VHGGCCTVEVTPADAADGRLQTKLDAAATGRILRDRAARITVCFAPGHYELPAPVVLTSMHSRMTLQGCSRAAVLSAQAGAERTFDQGLIVLTGADDVTLTGLELRLPLAPRDQAPAGPAYASIGIRPVDCAVLEISECLFRFAVGGEEEGDPTADVTGVGVFAGGHVRGCRVVRNEFRHPPLSPVPREGPRRILVGYLGSAAVLPFGREDGEDVGRDLLDALELGENVFAGLALAAYLVARLGSVRIGDNTVRDCYAGFYLLDSGAAARTHLAGTFPVRGTDVAVVTAIGSALAASLTDEVALVLTAFAGTYLLPPSAEAAQERTRLDADADSTARVAFDAQRQAWTARLLEQVAAEHPAPHQEGEAQEQQVAFEAPHDRPGADRDLLAAVDEVHARAGLGAAEDAADTPSAAFLFTCNDVDCRLPDGSPTGPALFLLGPRREVVATSTAVVGDNRLVALFTGTVAGITGYDDVTITGNVCLAADSDAASPLTVSAVTRPAITGNVLFRYPQLPANRPFPPPLDSWDPLNTRG
jgi:hypothetical protein